MCAPVLDKRGGMFIRGEIWMSAIVDEGAKLYTPLFASLAADGICAAQWTQRRRRSIEEWSSIQNGALTNKQRQAGSPACRRCSSGPGRGRNKGASCTVATYML